jgi:hypothetical protein
VISGIKPDTDHPADGAACAAPAIPPQTTVFLLPFEKSELESFAAWSAAMTQMAELQRKAASLGCPATQKVTKAGTSASSLSSYLSLTPAGPPLALAQAALGLLESEEATMAVSGNIGDLALMNGLARNLMALHIAVVTPSSLLPASLSVSDDTTSPFLASKSRTLLASGCLSGLTPKTDQATQTIADITSFMDSLGPAKSSKTTTPPTTVTPATNTTTQAPVSTASALSEILQADGWAQRMGYSFDTDTGRLKQPQAGSYVLMVKALESGGSVTGTSNILGVRLRYSGGSVATYALFALDGDLACSGNVYDYVGPLKGKDFEQRLREFHINPAQQVILHSSTCPASGSAAPAVPASNPVR